MNTFLSIIPILILCGLARFSFRIWGPLAPAFVFSSFWSIILGIQQVFAFDLPVGAFSIWFIALVGMFGFVLNYVVWDASKNKLASRKRKPIPHLSIKSFEFFLILGLGAISLALCFWGMHVSGYGPSTLFSPNKFSNMASAFSTARYRNQPDHLSIKLALFLILFNATFCGYYIWTFSKRVQFFAFLFTFGPCVLLTAILTMKATTLFCLTLFLSSAAGSLLLIDKKISLPRHWMMYLYSLSFLGFIGFTTTTMMRYSLKGLSGFITAANKLRLDVLGFMGPFSYWLDGFKSGIWNDELSWGALSLAGPYQVLGIKHRPPGLYSESIFITNTHFSNIYTMFRGFLNDFGAKNALLILGLIFAISSVAWIETKCGSKWTVPIYSGFFLTVLCSHIILPFTYNTITVAWLLSSGILVMRSYARN
jgi:hypothetical protein